MAINKSKGNMYEDYDTWNFIYGRCYHNCLYCYNRRWWQKWGAVKLNERVLKDNLGSGNRYFVGSSCDIFAEDIPFQWILTGLKHLNKFPDNYYLFQTRNTYRYLTFISEMPPNSIFGTTIETNRDYKFSEAPRPYYRKEGMQELGSYLKPNNRMISIEPIMDFDLNILVRWIREIQPDYVSIGANSNFKVKLPEPSKEKIQSLIDELGRFTYVKIKKNLKRLGDFAHARQMPERLQGL